MGKRKGGAGAGVSLVQYKGPIQRKAQQPQTYRVPLRQTYNISSAAAGYVEIFATTANATGCSEWASIAPLWREYRVLGLRLEYMPCYDMSGTNRTCYPGAIASYHGPIPAWQGAVTSSSFNNTWLMEGSTTFHPCRSFVKEWRMGDVEEAQFFNTSASYSAGGIYGVTGGTTSASTVFGAVYITVLVEFKGRV